HPRRVARRVRVLDSLRDERNALLVVEEDEQIVRGADNLIDSGPGRGERGGEMVWTGGLEGFLRSARGLHEGVPDSRALKRSLRRDTRATQSLTHDYLTHRKSIPVPKSRRKFSSVIKIAGATEHNRSEEHTSELQSPYDLVCR